jgi:hemerythrin superfamily protein
MKSQHDIASGKSTSKRQKADEQKDAIAVLTEDHRAVKRLFEAFRRADDDDLERKGALVRRACEELTVHTILEEELLYPEAQQALSEDDRPDVEEAFVEHFLVKTLIDKFASLKPADRGFDATFKVLMEMVEHHIEEEESELFPELKKSRADLVDLGAQIIKRKTALEAKLPKDAGDQTLQMH